jgi:hypothetical protein
LIVNLNVRKMEFLLQLFADLMGKPGEEETSVGAHITEKKEIPEAEPGEKKEEVVEGPVLFDLMQFH